VVGAAGGGLTRPVVLRDADEEGVEIAADAQLEPVGGVGLAAEQAGGGQTRGGEQKSSHWLDPLRERGGRGPASAGIDRRRIADAAPKCKRLALSGHSVP
jgi:hypothetical protein